MARTSGLSSHLFAFALMVLLSPSAFADPPGRVGRLADLRGQVWLYDAETADWVQATRNLPLTSGDRVSTDGDGRAELRVGSTTVRLDAGTEIEVLQLDDDRVRVQLHNGVLALRLRTHEAAREFELVTAEGIFRPDRAGRYRLDRLDATSSITVWGGQLVFEAPDNGFTLGAGQRADILVINGRTQQTLVQPQRDAFADEVAAAEGADERSVSAQYVSPEMTGAEELDRNGRWESDVEYGPLWVPRAVVPGWAPYRFGRWAWVQPWGWTWIDDASWGFAPFHYGRWIYRRNNWCWSPGTWVARPVYAPALVAWVGAPPTGGSVGVGPRVGWFPLGPREVFVPGYRTSSTYIRNVNVTHVTNITNITTIVNNPNRVVQQTNYVNRGVPGAVTVVPAGVVAGRQPVAPSRVQLTDPRPSAGGARDMEVAALPVVTAAAPIQAPPPRRNLAPASGATGPAPGGASPPVAPARPGAPAATVPGAVAAAPAAAAIPQPPMTRPVVRQPRPSALPVDPAAAVPAEAVPARPPRTASSEGRWRASAPAVAPTVPTATPTAPEAQSQPAAATPATPPRRHRPSPAAPTPSPTPPAATAGQTPPAPAKAAQPVAAATPPPAAARPQDAAQPSPNAPQAGPRNRERMADR